MRGRLAIVFDDAFEEGYTEIGPLVRDRGVPASLAVTVDGLARDGSMTVGQLSELVGAGCEVIAHGREHRFLQSRRLANDAPAGADRIALASGHAFPNDGAGVLPGDEFELVAETHSETRVVADTGGSDDAPTAAFETPLANAYDASETRFRPTESLLRDEIVGVKVDLRDLGFDPRAFAFPYDAADARAWRLARSEYDALVNATV